MRLAELIGMPVVDQNGTSVGVVHDVRARVERDRTWEVTGIVIDHDRVLTRAAHAWGYASGRCSGPAPFRVLFHRAARDARFAPVGLVAAWGPDAVRLDARRAELAPLAEVLL
jgi:hypothetical protein